MSNSNGYTALHVALTERWSDRRGSVNKPDHLFDDSFIRKLIEKMNKDSIDHRLIKATRGGDTDRSSALLMALGSGRGTELVSALLEKGVSVCEESLKIALNSWPLDIVDKILTSIDVSKDTIITYLRNCSGVYRKEVLHCLIERVGIESHDLGQILVPAVAFGSLHVVEDVTSLIPRDYDYDSPVKPPGAEHYFGPKIWSVDGVTPLQAACMRTDLLFEVFEKLLELGCDPNVSDPRSGKTPLGTLVDTDHDGRRRENKDLTRRCIALLIKHGADTDKTDRDGLLAGLYVGDVGAWNRVRTWSTHQVLGSNPARLISIASQLKRKGEIRKGHMHRMCRRASSKNWSGCF